MVEVFNVIHHGKLGSRDPSKFFVSTFVTQPLNVIDKRASELMVKFRVQDL